MRSAFATLATLALLVLSGASLPVRAQGVAAPRVAHEVRVDALGGRGATSVQAGLGVQIPAGYYVRMGIVGGIGAPLSSHSGGADARLDLLGRFLLDPFRQSAWGLSAGGGLSLRADHGDRVRPHLLVLVDLEGRRAVLGASPTVQVGMGGGFRAGVGLRYNGRTTR